MYLEFLQDFFNGLRDSLYGFYFVTKLDAEDEPEQKAAPPKEVVPTVLAQRRAEARRLREGSQPKPEKPPEPIVRHRVKAWKRVAQCVFLNFLCIVVFYALLLPLFSLLSYYLLYLVPERVAHWVEVAGSVLPALSILPFFIFSRIVNALWFSDIASACLRSLRPSPPVPRSPIETISDFIVSIVLELIFLLQSALASHVPIPMVAPVVNFVHLSLLYSLYSFEYFWMARNRSLRARIDSVERRWPYFLGFGSILTLCTTTLCGDRLLLSGCVFGALFPFFIISSYRAKWNDRHGSPAPDTPPQAVIPPIRIFMPTQMVTNWLSARISDYFLSRQPTPRQR